MILQKSGNTSVTNDRFVVLTRGFEKNPLNNFKTKTGKLFGPNDIFGSNDLFGPNEWMMSKTSSNVAGFKKNDLLILMFCCKVSFANWYLRDQLVRSHYYL